MYTNLNNIVHKLVINIQEIMYRNLNSTSSHSLPGYQSSPSTRIPVPTLYQDTSPNPLTGYQSPPSTRKPVLTLYQDTSPHPLPGYQF